MENQAAYLPEVKALLEVKPAPFTHPGPKEVLIRNSVLGINPLEVVQQDYGVTVQKWPHIPGLDIAGTIFEVGSEVTRFKKGNRVAALSTYIRTEIPAQGAFQLYTVVPEYLVSHVPDNLGLANACVFPLGIATAAMGLFEPAHIGLDPPTVALAGKNKQKNKDKAILIWGGSSTVGGCAVQLCAAVGLTVLAIASSKNHQYVTELGADYVFDHADENIVKHLIDAAKGKKVVGAYDAISNEETAQKSAEFLHAFGGGTLFATRSSVFAPGQTLLGDVRRIAGHPPSRTEKGELLVWMKVWAEFMGEGLKTGTLKAKPNPIIIKGGLEKLQSGMDLYRQGVSASKIVVEL